MAKALIIDDPFGKLAQKFYNRFPDEPIADGLSIVVEKPKLVAHMSLDTLLQAIIDAWKSKDFEGNDLLLVTHGNQRGMSMRLFPGHRTDARTDVLDTLIGLDSDDDKAKKLFVTPAQVQGLLAKIDQVRKSSLSSVEFRGCSIGLDTNNLSMLKRVFGCVSVSGPDLKSTYGTVTARVLTAQQMDHWMRQYGNVSADCSGSNGRIAFRATLSNPAILDLATESRAALPDFIDQIMPGKPRSTEGWMLHALPVHYLTDQPPILPRAGDFAGHIVRSS